MKILFATCGTLGDIHPYIAVAIEAKKRGHDPVVATAPKFRATVERLGMKFFPARIGLEEQDEAAFMDRAMNSAHPTRTYCEELINRHSRSTYSDLLLAAEDVDVIVAHQVVITAPLVAKTLNKKWISANVAPVAMISASDLGVPGRLRRIDRLGLLSPLWKRFAFERYRRFSRAWFREYDALRRDIGQETRTHPIAPTRYSPYGNLALFSEHFAPRQASWPKNTEIAGFCFYDAGQRQNSNAQADWRAWMQQGEAPIVFAPGSSSVWAAHEFWQASAEKIRHSNERGVFLTAGQNLFANSDLKDKILELDYVPYSKVFPHAKVVVHAGGIGTAALALMAGKPQLIIPQAFDQFDNAARAERRGFAVKANLHSYKNGEAFQRLFDQFDTLDAQAKQLGEKIRQENGPIKACEFLERQFLKS